MTLILFNNQELRIKESNKFANYSLLLKVIVASFVSNFKKRQMVIICNFHIVSLPSTKPPNKKIAEIALFSLSRGATLILTILYVYHGQCESGKLL